MVVEVAFAFLGDNAAVGLGDADTGREKPRPKEIMLLILVIVASEAMVLSE